MTPQEKLRFEAYARSCGYNLNKEGERYCHGVVNQLKDTWVAALHAQRAEPQIPAPALQPASSPALAQHGWWLTLS